MRTQLHVDRSSSFAIVVLSFGKKVFRYAPNTLLRPFDNTGATQRFQTSGSRPYDLLMLFAIDGDLSQLIEMRVSAVYTVSRDCGDASVQRSGTSGSARLDDRASREAGQISRST